MFTVPTDLSSAETKILSILHRNTTLRRSLLVDVHIRPDLGRRTHPMTRASKHVDVPWRSTGHATIPVCYFTVAAP
uniref:Uncharacterized protein n=1 Tax=Anguilla anguilla TaxID=7936 RepID=A0A0E9XGJ2_ANGAN